MSVDRDRRAAQAVLNYVWDTSTLDFVVMTQPGAAAASSQRDLERGHDEVYSVQCGAWSVTTSALRDLDKGHDTIYVSPCGTFSVTASPSGTFTIRDLTTGHDAVFASQCGAWTVSQRDLQPGRDSLLVAPCGTFTVTVAQPTPVKQAGTSWPVDLSCIANAAVLTGVGSGGLRVVVSQDSPVVGPVVTKGVQCTSGYMVQNLSDAGRTCLSFYCCGVTAAATGVETMLTLNKVNAYNSSETTGTSFVVTSGKVFRITALVVGTRGNATATAQVTTFNLRTCSSGATTAVARPVVVSARSATIAASEWDRLPIPLPDGGIDISGNGTLTFGVSANAVFTTNAPTWDVILVGYEY